VFSPNNEKTGSQINSAIMASLHQKQGQEFDQIIDEIAKEVKFLSVFLGHEKLIIFHCQPE